MRYKAGVNLLNYVWDDPTNRTDYAGLLPSPAEGNNSQCATDDTVPGRVAGRVCAIPLFDNGGIDDKIKRQARIVGDYVHEPGLSSPYDLPWIVRMQQCCTLYLFGHQGSNWGSRGGIVTRPNPIPIPRDGEPEVEPEPPLFVLPNSYVEEQLRAAFRAIGCKRCAINIVACGGTDPSHRQTRKLIAKSTGCAVCGSTQFIRPGGEIGDGCCTLGKPCRGKVGLGDDEWVQQPWPHECEYPPGGGGWF